MKKEYLYPLLVGVSIATISASGKAYIDVVEMKVENKYIKLAIQKMHVDIKDIKKLLQEN